MQHDALARIRDQVKEELKEELKNQIRQELIDQLPKESQDVLAKMENGKLLNSNSQILNHLGHSNSKDYSMQNNSLNEYKFGMISNGDKNSGAQSQ